MRTKHERYHGVIFMEHRLGKGGIKNWSKINLIRIFVLKLRQKRIKLKLQCKIGKKIQNLNKNLVKI